MQLDLLLTLLNVVTRIVAFVPNSLFVGWFCIEITVKPFSMVFSLQSEKCVKAVEGHMYYNKTKGRNNRASILKSSDIQHIIALVILVGIRRVAKGRRHLNPAAPFSIDNEKDAGVLFPSLFLPLCVMCLEWSLNNMPLCQFITDANVQFVGICSSTLNSSAHLLPRPGSGHGSPPSPVSIMQIFLHGIRDQRHINWLNNEMPPVNIQLSPPPQKMRCLGIWYKTGEKRQ